MNITKSNDLVIQMTDKKVSICIQEKPNYIHIALDHLSDILTYKRVSLQEIPHILDPQFYRKALETLFDKYSIKHDQLLQFILQRKHHKVEADPYMSHLMSAIISTHESTAVVPDITTMLSNLHTVHRSQRQSNTGPLDRPQPSLAPP